MEQTTDIRLLNEKIEKESSFVDIIRMEMNKVIVGQKHLTDSLMIGLLANGHILLEGVPGLAKTLAIKSLASIIDAKFSRIQFTRQITIGENTFRLDEPFLVLATQNPIEQEGTYPLPEAQVDRFMMKVLIDYPAFEEEKLIVRENLAKEFPKTQTVLKPSDIVRARDVVREIYMDEKIENYILNIVFASRDPEKYGLPAFKNMISYGASPRASINLALAAKAYAFLRRRGYVIPEDIRAICPDVMRHRIGLTYEAEAENINQDKIIAEILNVVEVP
jgi:MoxR-like ATPase